jgi:hypothetical protein
MKRLFLVLTVGLLWSTNAALAAPITQNNKLSISAVSSVFTEIYAIPKADRSKPVLSDNQKIQEQNIAADPAHKRAQVAAQNSAVVKENSYKH